MTPLRPRRHDRFELWAPAAKRVTIQVNGVEHPMASTGGGWFELPGVAARPGDRYAFRLDGPEAGAGTATGSAGTSEDLLWLPDPRSLSQPDGVHGASEVVALPAPSRLSDSSRVRQSLRGGVIYELHVGTFTPGPDSRGGTLDSAIERLDHLVDLGIDAVELMPLAAFPGDRGWGYDGVGLYAVHAAYGGPAALDRFVKAAHRRGIAVLLDVVFNHLGPAGNYLGQFGPYFTDEHETPWGQAVNLDQPGSAQVRAFLLGAAHQWLVELGLDGLRLDAVHELKDDSEQHFLAELADHVARWEIETGRTLTLIAESDRNDPLTVTPTATGGLGMDMQWADDVHHGVHAWITGERAGYYCDFGSADVLATVLSRIFLHSGTYSTFRDRIWGAPVDPGSLHYDGHSFVLFLQDHDQIGNRAAGDRIHHSLSPAEHAAAITLVLLGPGTPMLFQGEEWAATAPFTYFTDHDEELGPLVSAGRATEFAAMGWDQEVPDPQDRSTFEASILDWSERARTDHTQMLTWYRKLITLRRDEPDLASGDLRRTAVEVLGEETVMMRRGEIAVLAHRGPGTVEVPQAGTAELLAAFTDAAGPTGGLACAPSRLAGAGVLVLRLPARP